MCRVLGNAGIVVALLLLLLPLLLLLLLLLTSSTSSAYYYYCYLFFYYYCYLYYYYYNCDYYETLKAKELWFIVQKLSHSHGLDADPELPSLSFFTDSQAFVAPLLHAGHGVGRHCHCPGSACFCLQFPCSGLVVLRHCSETS